MNYIYKINFPTKEDWEKFKAKHLLNEKSELKLEFNILGEGHLPKPPAADWQPDPNNPEDSGWTVYDDYSVDVMSSVQTDIFNDYLIKKPDKALREVQGAKDTEIIYKQ
jgi:hypothetical protein